MLVGRDVLFSSGPGTVHVSHPVRRLTVFGVHKMARSAVSAYLKSFYNSALIFFNVAFIVYSKRSNFSSFPVQFLVRNIGPIFKRTKVDFQFAMVHVGKKVQILFFLSC